MRNVRKMDGTVKQIIKAIGKALYGLLCFMLNPRQSLYRLMNPRYYPRKRK